MSATLHARYIFVAAMSLGIVGCSTTPSAQDPVYLKLTDLEARLIRIERVVDNQSLIELSAEVAQLRTQSQALLGEIETLQYESEWCESSASALSRRGWQIANP